MRLAHTSSRPASSWIALTQKSSLLSPMVRTSINKLFDGAAFRVILQNLPRVQRNGINRYAGFVQDQWTIGDRLTLNLGVRWENTEGWLPETSIGGGRWFPLRSPSRRPATSSTGTSSRRALAWCMRWVRQQRTSLKAYYGRHYRPLLNTGLWVPFHPLREEAQRTHGTT